MVIAHFLNELHTKHRLLLILLTYGSLNNLSNALMISFSWICFLSFSNKSLYTFYHVKPKSLSDYLWLTIVDSSCFLDSSLWHQFILDVGLFLDQELQDLQVKVLAWVSLNFSLGEIQDALPAFFCYELESVDLDWEFMFGIPYSS